MTKEIAEEVTTQSDEPTFNDVLQAIRILDERLTVLESSFQLHEHTSDARIVFKKLV